MCLRKFVDWVYILIIYIYSMTFSSQALRNPIVNKVVFLGTPSVGARSLELLHQASLKSPLWEVSDVITQPPQLMGRGRKRLLTQSSVGLMAENLGITSHVPEKIGTPEFLDFLGEEIQPDLCITAAYGQYLPKRFLSIPRLGTLNIHPSLLPHWRGASPVQRSIEAGDTEIGVSVLWTVSKMDAGPIVSQISHTLNGDETADQVLMNMFEKGTKSLIDVMPNVLDGSCTPLTSMQQDDSLATSANKITAEEAQVSFGANSALTIHNRVRAFSTWPGVWTYVKVGSGERHRLKLVKTKLVLQSEIPTFENVNEVKVCSGRMFVACVDGSCLELLEVQSPDKRVMSAPDFINGLRKRTMSWEP